MTVDTYAGQRANATRVALLDYGVGNLHSLFHAIAAVGAAVSVESDPTRAMDADMLVLPGVGSYAAAARHIGVTRSLLRHRLQCGLPCIGICLGMQLLLEASDEGPGQGIGLIAGKVERLQTRRVPHMGWNQVDVPSLRGGGEIDTALRRSGLTEAYYANSYVCRPRDLSTVTAWTSQDTEAFPSIIRHHHVIGVQFHPEKSGAPGLHFLRALVQRAPARRRESAPPDHAGAGITAEGAS